MYCCDYGGEPNDLSDCAGGTDGDEDNVADSPFYHLSNVPTSWVISAVTPNDWPVSPRSGDKFVTKSTQRLRNQTHEDNDTCNPGNGKGNYTKLTISFTHPAKFRIDSTTQPDGEYTFNPLGSEYVIWGGPYYGTGARNEIYLGPYTYWVKSGKVSFTRPVVTCVITTMPSFHFDEIIAGAAENTMNLPLSVSCSEATRVTMDLIPINADIISKPGWITIKTINGVVSHTAFEFNYNYSISRDEEITSGFQRKIEVRVHTEGAVTGGAFSHIIPLVINYD